MKSVKTADPQEFFSYIAGESINSYNHFLALLSPKVDIHFEHFDPGIPLLSTYPAATCATSPIQKFQSRIIHNIPQLETTQMLITLRQINYNISIQQYEYTTMKITTTTHICE